VLVNSTYELRTPVGDNYIIKTVILLYVFIEQFSRLLRSGSLVPIVNAIPSYNSKRTEDVNLSLLNV